MYTRNDDSIRPELVEPIKNKIELDRLSIGIHVMESKINQLFEMVSKDPEQFLEKSDQILLYLQLYTNLHISYLEQNTGLSLDQKIGMASFIQDMYLRQIEIAHATNKEAMMSPLQKLAFDNQLMLDELQKQQEQVKVKSHFSEGRGHDPRLLAAPKTSAQELKFIDNCYEQFVRKNI